MKLAQIILEGLNYNPQQLNPINEKLKVSARESPAAIKGSMAPVVVVISQMFQNCP